MLHIVYNLGMKLAHHKNGLCRRNIFGENKTVKYDVHVDAKKKKVFVYCCSIKYVKLRSNSSAKPWKTPSLLLW